MDPEPATPRQRKFLHHLTHNVEWLDCKLTKGEAGIEIRRQRNRRRVSNV